MAQETGIIYWKCPEEWARTDQGCPSMEGMERRETPRKRAKRGVRNTGREVLQKPRRKYQEGYSSQQCQRHRTDWRMATGQHVSQGKDPDSTVHSERIQEAGPRLCLVSNCPFPPPPPLFSSSHSLFTSSLIPPTPHLQISPRFYLSWGKKPSLHPPFSMTYSKNYMNICLVRCVWVPWSLQIFYHNL